MSVSKGNILNQLLQNWPKGTVATSAWLKEQGVSMSLIKRYRASNWIESIGRGAAIRTGDKVEWQGALCALQQQLHIKIHVGGKSALELQGYAHFIKLGKSTTQLFFQKRQKLPTWFLKNDWGTSIQIHETQFLTESEGIIAHRVGDYSIMISGPERSFLETLYLVPKQQGLKESYYLLENLIDLRPSVLQLLLERVNSIRVKRLFFFLADKINHPWLARLDRSRINLGSGKRQIIKDGIFDKNYMITVPKDFIDDGGD